MFDITKKRVFETARIDLTDGDGAPLNDDEGNRLGVTLCGPGSKTWQQADAERNRRIAQRAEKNPRKWQTELAAQRREDEIDFLVSITVSFNGWDYPHPEGQTWGSQRDMFKAAYADDTIGYIRDQLTKEGNDWSAFSNRGAPTSASTSDSSLG